MEGFRFASCIRFSLQLFMAEAVFAGLFPVRKRWQSRLLWALAAYTLCLWLVYSVMIQIPGGMVLVQMIYYVLVFSLTLWVIWIVFDVKGREALFVGVGGYALQHMAFGITRLVAYFLGLDTSTMFGAFINRWCFFYLLPSLFSLIFQRIDFDREALQQRNAHLIWLSAMILFTSILLSLLMRSDHSGEGNEFLQSFICSIYIILCCGLELFLLFYIPREVKLRHDYMTMEQMIRTMDDRLQISKRNVEIINRKCHDIKYQLRVLMQTQDKAEISAYVQEIGQEISVYESTYQVGNAALDFVLCERTPVFQEEQIQFTCMADGELLEFMQPLDITTLFGNALDNAIESVVQEPDQEKRLIQLQVTKRGEMVHIHLENYCPQQVTFVDGIPLTSKKDADFHGFGVRSIRHIVEKYDGILSFHSENHKFSLDIACLIPQNANALFVNN